MTFALNMTPKSKTSATSAKKLYARKPITDALARFGRKPVRRKKTVAKTTQTNR